MNERHHRRQAVRIPDRPDEAITNVCNRDSGRKRLNDRARRGRNAMTILLGPVVVVVMMMVVVSVRREGQPLGR